MPIYSALATLLVVCWIACRLTVCWRGSRRIFFAILILISLMMPTGEGVLVLHRVYALLGEMSVVSVLWMIIDLLRGRAQAPKSTASVLYFCALMALLLYASALGFFAWDWYQWGYYGWPLPLALTVGLWIAAWRRYRLACVLLGGVILAYIGKIHPSTNLWDYLLDVWLAIIAWGYAVRQVVRRGKAIHRSQKRAL